MRVFTIASGRISGAQLTLFEAADGWHYALWTTNWPATTKGWLGQNAYIDAAHRVHARIEDAIRTGKETGLGHLLSHDFAVNAAWLTIAMTGQILLAWLNLLSLDGGLAKAEPKTMRYRVLHAAALAGTRRMAAPAKNPGILTAGRGHHRLAAHRYASASPLNSANHPCDPRKDKPRARGLPATAPPVGPPSTQTLKSRSQAAPPTHRASHQSRRKIRASACAPSVKYPSFRANKCLTDRHLLRGTCLPDSVLSSEAQELGPSTPESDPFIRSAFRHSAPPRMAAV
jgi:hypothetical protein